MPKTLPTLSMLAILSALTITGCSNSGTEDTPDPDVSSSVTAPGTEVPSAPPTDDTSGDDTDINAPAENTDEVEDEVFQEKSLPRDSGAATSEEKADEEHSEDDGHDHGSAPRLGEKWTPEPFVPEGKVTPSPIPVPDDKKPVKPVKELNLEPLD